MEQTPIKTEKLVYVIQTFQTHGHPSELTDDKFIQLATNGGEVYQLQAFAAAYNDEIVSSNDTYIRII